MTDIRPAPTSEEDYEDLYEHAPCGYISTLPDGRFVKANQTFLSWIGYQGDALLAGKRFQDLLPVAGKIFHETHFLPLLRMQGFVNEIAFELICHDGQRLPILLNSVLRRDMSGVPVLYRTTIFRSTDRRQYERELQLARKRAEQALRLRDQFLSLAAHELKTPMTSILGHIQLIQRRLTKQQTVTPRDLHAVQVIADQAKRLNQMVLSLFDISRIETGQLSIERSPMDVVALVRRVVDEMQMTLEQPVIEFEPPETPVIILADELRLEQVFQNLIQNALKYSGPGTSIRVTLMLADTSVRIAVHDRGIGIPSASLPQLFERFYRATNVDGGNISGMGIGLYVVKEIVELHGGEVHVASTEGQGSTFTVHLPLAR